MTQQLATQGERHAKCGRMVAYGEMHWIDECKPTTPLQTAVADYEQAMLDLAQGWREHPRTMDSITDLVRAERKINDATARIASAKVAISDAIAALKATVETAQTTY